MTRLLGRMRREGDWVLLLAAANWPCLPSGTNVEIWLAGEWGEVFEVLFFCILHKLSSCVPLIPNYLSHLQIESV